MAFVNNVQKGPELRCKSKLKNKQNKCSAETQQQNILMHRPSLENSYRENQADQIIQDSLRTREYLEQTSNQLIQYFEELAQESDPKKAYEITLKQRRQKDRKYDQIVAQNIRLNHKVKNLEAEVHKLSLQNRTLLSNLNGSGKSPQKLENGRASQIKESESPHSSIGAESSHVPNLWISESRQRMMDGLDQQMRLAREIEVFEVQQIRKIQCSVEILMERIQKMIDFNKFQQSIQVDPNYPKKTVLIPQAKYQKLLDFYFQHSVLLSQKEEKSPPKSSQPGSDNPSEVETKQFEPSSKQEIISEQENPTSSEIDDLRQLFTMLAQKNGLGKSWSLYLKNSQSQAEEFRSQIQSIAKCEFDIDKKIRCQGIIRKINQSCVSKNTQQQTTIQTQKKELQQVLFQKIAKLLQKLSFDQRELDLFHQFDQKRKNDRLFSLDEFINKFKSKQDLAEISKQYTLKFLQTLNLLVMKILNLLANIQPSEADKVSKLFEWIKSRFDAKSNQARSSMLNVLEKEIEKYLDEKNYQKTKKNRNIEPIPTPKFDPDKLFENELKRIVNEYEKLFESSIFNCRRQVKFILK